MSDLFEHLSEHKISVHTLLALQESYPNLQPDELQSYENRIALRIKLLTEFAQKNDLPISNAIITSCLSDVPNTVLNSLLPPAPSHNKDTQTTAQKTVTLLNGGPASGKSQWISSNPPAKNTVTLDRDSYFDQLPPYPRLKVTHPDHATHVVVCEAILYNERDAYQYAIMSGAENMLVDGTMSYRDLGHEMIDTAQTAGYHVKLIHVDCDVDLAIRRAEKRAATTGKTINTKLLYESHVRCTYNFLEYKEKADEVESWNTDGNQATLIATKEEILNQTAFNNLHKKSQLPLDNPSWPPNFDDFLKQRTK